jgi:hypothetical protein
MDESGNGNVDQPLLVGAVVVDGDEQELEERIRTLHKDLSARRSLRGYEGFEKFRKSGFHASTDPLEVSQRFIEVVQRSAGVKIYIMITNNRSGTSTTEMDQVSAMYESIVADNLLRYHNRSELIVCIEENHQLKPLLQTLPTYARYRAIEKIGIGPQPLPPIRVEMVKKGSIMTLAIVDYAMLAVSKWIKKDYPRDPSVREYRALREILPSASFIYSLEDGLLASRKVYPEDV